MRDNRVYFLGPPEKGYSVSQTEYKNVFKLDYSGFIKGLRFLPRLIIQREIQKVYRRLEKEAGVKFDIIWSFDNSVFFDFRAIPDSVLKISHIVDLNQNFQRKLSAKTADYCFATTDYICEELIKHNSKTFKINHGFNEVKINPQNLSLPGSNRIKAIYAGNLDMPYLDWELLFRVVEKHKAIDFIFIGPNGEMDNSFNNYKSKSLQQSNVFSIGKINSNQLGNYYTRADMLLISYQGQYHNDQANPHKMMEYLGAGKVIIATYTNEFKDLMDENLIAMSINNQNYLDKFSEVTSNLSFWNNESLVQMRKSYALNNTYNKQIERIEEKLSESFN